VRRSDWKQRRRPRASGDPAAFERTTLGSRFRGNDEPLIMLWAKSLHIVFLVSWYAGLFYLPRLFVYHAMTSDAPGNERFKVMERKLYYGIMTPSAILTIGSGLWLWLGYGIGGGWLYAKLALVAILVVHHLWLGKLMRDFREDRNRHGHVFYRWINEVPALPVLVFVVLLVLFKPL
jgi:putative membrane protein